MEQFILPYADMLGYCLMPNHFHWLIYVNHLEIETEKNARFLRQVPPKRRTLNDSIGILLRSYCRAINIQEGRTGSLFQKKTKAKTPKMENFVSMDGAYKDYYKSYDDDYLAQCLDYIHFNPVKAKYVQKPQDWEFSSAAEYADFTRPGLCNRVLTRQMLGL